MRKRLSLILALLTLFVGFAAAQNTVSGVVVSGDGIEEVRQEEALLGRLGIGLARGKHRSQKGDHLQ